MIPENTIMLVKAFEGFRPKPYYCPAGVPTIGYGTTRYPDGKAVAITDLAISRSTALLYMTAELEECTRKTLRLCPTLNAVPRNWLGAIVDFVYNLGAGRLQTSTLRKKINNEAWDEVPEQLEKWVYASGRKLKGLVLRRQAEAGYF